MAGTKTRTKKKVAKKKARKRASPPPPLPEGLSYRNKGIKRVRVGDILENPFNFREHPEAQHQALDAAVSEIGWYGYPDVFEHPDHPGKVMLVDGALRRKDLIDRYGEDAYIDVNLVDFTPEEARKALASKDPITMLAINNEETLANLVDEIREGETSDQFSDLLGTLQDSVSAAVANQELAQAAADDASNPGDRGGVSDPNATGGDPGVDNYREQYAVILMCESENHQREVFELMQADGYDCRVVTT